MTDSSEAAQTHYDAATRREDPSGTGAGGSLEIGVLGWVEVRVIIVAGVVHAVSVEVEKGGVLVVGRDVAPGLARIAPSVVVRVRLILNRTAKAIVVVIGGARTSNAVLPVQPGSWTCPPPRVMKTSQVVKVALTVC